MGVTGLWTIVQPCARPIKLETLNRKRLAVDASIWIYQFLKAVRDKEGDALRNSHVVGFFRRICKLLFVGILPVFVFDGGAPALKKQTVNARRQRREGRREDAVRTAGKLLALQMGRLAEEEEEKRRRQKLRPAEEEEVVNMENVTYVDELGMSNAEKQQNRQQDKRFKKKDQYHLPELDASMAEMGGANDPRIMNLDELEAYARQFDTGEDINVYDFAKIDFDSPFFTSLPASDRYNILNAARLRSRLRMGYSKDQLDTMFPNRMEFSKFQIDRVTERNELTQRLMNINGMTDDGLWGVNGNGRVAGEKGREYVLVRNEGVEGGWALGVVSNRDEGQREKPIDVEKLAEKADIKDEEEMSESEDDFEDVPVEGLNRLPKTFVPKIAQPGSDIGKRRKALYKSRRRKRSNRIPKLTTANTDPESLFVTNDKTDDVNEESDVDEDEEDDDMQEFEDEEEELSRAIALSLQPEDNDLFGNDQEEESPSSRDMNMGALGVFQQKKVEDGPSFKDSKGSSAIAIARTANARAARAPNTSIFQAESDSENEENKEVESEIKVSHENKTRKTNGADAAKAARIKDLVKETAPVRTPSTNPLPFERLDLGSSLFSRKKIDEMHEKQAGGFEKSTDKKEDAQPLPPWFAGDIDADLKAQNAIEHADRQKVKEFQDQQRFEFTRPSVLRRGFSSEVIDIDAPVSQGAPEPVLIIDEEDAKEDTGIREPAPIVIDDNDVGDTSPMIGQNSNFETKEHPTMGDLAEEVRISPPSASVSQQRSPVPVRRQSPSETVNKTGRVTNNTSIAEIQDKDEIVDWSASEEEIETIKEKTIADQEEEKDKDDIPTTQIGQVIEPVKSKSPSPEFEEVNIPAKPDRTEESRKVLEAQIAAVDQSTKHTTGLADQYAVPSNTNEADEEFAGALSDSDDEELMHQLEAEAQEHARFAAELNQKSQHQNMLDYEKELKQLRSQQKRDRRDADEVTQTMITECQQLLRLFGLPFITAPMEAEAQCAELVQLGLVDGIVTDDSDCFLFGGTRIYKNMFNQAKFVECYLISDLEKEFDLTRQKLISLAQLLGSDYAEGLKGVGPVTALEILSEFGDLSSFNEWWTGVQQGRITKQTDQPVPFRRKFRKTNATKLFLPPTFPDPRVEMAYLKPEVDSDASQFQWGVPDLSALREFLMQTIGWGPARTDEILVPVIRDMNRRQDEGTQSNITRFLAGNNTVGLGAGSKEYAPRVKAGEGSKRLGGALGRMADKAKRRREGGIDETYDGTDEVETEQREVKKGKSKKRKSTGADDDGNDVNENNDDDGYEGSDQAQSKKKRKQPSTATKKSKKRKVANSDNESEEEHELE